MKQLFSGLAALACLAAVPAAHATERESMEQLRNTTLSLIQMLVQEGVLSKEKAETLIKQAEAAKQSEAQAAKKDEPAKDTAAKDEPNTVRVQYVPKFVKDQMREEIKNEVMAKAQAEGWVAPGSLPEWLGRIALEGDVRLRYEQDSFPAGNETPLNLQTQGTSISNTSENRERLRLRARLGLKLKIADDISGGLRLATGSAGDPVSTNQTLGGDYQSSSKFSFGLDRAYVKYAPLAWLSFSGGRMANPWLNTDLVWDPDFAFDGVTAAARPRIDEHLTLFGTLGAFPIQDVERTNSTPGSTGADKNVQAKSRWMYGAQAGFEWMSDDQSTYKMGVGYYDYTHIQGVLNTPSSTAQNLTARQFHQKGNTVFNITNPTDNVNPIFGLASKFREVDVTAKADFAAFSPTHVVLSGDYVKNIGFKASEVQALNPVSQIGGNTGWMARLLVGMPDTTHMNDWNVFGAYKRLETNAVLDAYTDSDFHLGGTNAKGWIVGGNYGLQKNTWLNLRWFSADEIVGAPLAIDVLMLDFNAKF